MSACWLDFLRKVFPQRINANQYCGEYFWPMRWLVRMFWLNKENKHSKIYIPVELTSESFICDQKSNARKLFRLGGASGTWERSNESKEWKESKNVAQKYLWRFNFVIILSYNFLSFCCLSFTDLRISHTDVALSTMQEKCVTHSFRGLLPVVPIYMLFYIDGGDISK